MNTRTLAPRDKASPPATSGGDGRGTPTQNAATPGHEAATASADRTRYRLALCLVALLLCLPLLSVTYPPLTDYPNHLARVHILNHYDEVPAFRETFDRQFAPIPNLGADLLILLLNQFFGIYAAGRVFLVLTALLFVAGCHLLGGAIHGHRTWLALPCCFFFYNSMLFSGFLSFLFGAGLFMVGLACWMRWRGRWTAARYALVSLLVFASYLSHLAAYVFLGVSFAVLALWSLLRRERGARGTALDLGHLVPPLAAFAAFMSGGGEAGGLAWNSLKGKFINALLPLDGYNIKLDALLVVVLVVAGVITYRRANGVGVARPTFVTGLVFCLLFLLAPKGALTAWSVDARFVVPATLLLVLSLRISLPRAHAKRLLLLLLAVLALRVGSAWATWATLDARIAAQTRAFDLLPEGARVYPLYVAPADWQRGRVERVFDHLAHYATIRRRAYLPTIFAWRSQQPLVIRTPPRHLAPSPGTPEQWLEASPRWLEYLSDYDYVWSYGADEQVARLLRTRAAPVAVADGFTLWKVGGEQ